ncbi:hypothetical protein [Rosistilla oblonga]|uniref:hypothetical protein n=1 Tax=Rosistilla oblonga TaxID=2527990 RepID=UPI003A96F58B
MVDLIGFSVEISWLAIWAAILAVVVVGLRLQVHGAVLLFDLFTALVSFAEFIADPTNVSALVIGISFLAIVLSDPGNNSRRKRVAKLIGDKSKQLVAALVAKAQSTRPVMQASPAGTGASK